MSRLNLDDAILTDPIIKNGFKLGVTRLSDAAATLSEDMGPIVSMTPSVSRTLTLPVATPARKGLTFIIVNAAAFTLVVQQPTGPSTVATIPASVGATGIFVCLGDTAQGVQGWSGGL